MSERIHDDEPDTSEPVVRALLAAECPQWQMDPLEYLATSGTDNAMWRIRLDGEPDVVVRLPRRPGAAAGVAREVAVLRQIESEPIASLVATPRVRHRGGPHPVFPFEWSVLEWIDGTDGWTSRESLGDGLAEQLGVAVLAIRQCDGAAVPRRRPGQRGGPLAPLLERLDGWLNDPQWNAGGLIDVGAVRRMADEARELVDEPVVLGFVHGDLIPGNVLLDHAGRLTAIIDWGGAGVGDVAQDLAPAWSLLSGPERPAFRSAVGADDAAWVRGRTFELEHAVGGVLYYVPRRHVLGDVMARTLDRILRDS